jgi:hypothetical protein
MTSAVGCGDPLNQNEPTTTASVHPNAATPPLAYGIAIDGVVSISFTAGEGETTVPVEENVWAYEGPSNALQSLTVHYADGTSQTLTDGRADTPNQRPAASKARPAGQASAQPSHSSLSGHVQRSGDWRAVVNDLLFHDGRLTRLYRCTSVRLARTKLAALPHRNEEYLQVLAAYIRSRC